MAELSNVIKRGNRITEPFNRNKLYDSVYSTCMSARSLDGVAKDTADQVCGMVSGWLHDKPEVTSNDIREQATNALKKFHPDAAYLYKHHKKIM